MTRFELMVKLLPIRRDLERMHEALANLPPRGMASEDVVEQMWELAERYHELRD